MTAAGHRAGAVRGAVRRCRGAAAAQLGDHDVAVRIAGVYAMAGVADESTGLRRQQCIDVLCGYLRLPYSPELGSNHQSKLVITEPRTGNVQRWRSRGSPPRPSCSSFWLMMCCWGHVSSRLAPIFADIC